MLGFTLFLSCSLFAFGSVSEKPAVAGSKEGTGPLFVTADRCMACHNGLVAPSGEDLSIGINWQGSMMANAARDPYWHAAVRREVLDHPSAQALIENECSACHMPMARFEAKANGQLEGVFENLPNAVAASRDSQVAMDGTSCSLCHQIQDSNLGKRESFTAGFSVDKQKALGERDIYGPFDIDPGRTRIMASASEFHPRKGEHIQKSEVCATCHTLFTHTLGPKGEVIGELPEQVPYLEWRHSSFANSKSCQDCHMVPVDGEMPISSVLGEPREGLSRHSFSGGNFFMPRVMNRYRAELGVTALPQELDLTSRNALQNLASNAGSIEIVEARVSGSRLEIDIEVINRAGHKLPTAYPSRRVWIRLAVLDREGKRLFESGAFNEDGSITGNDNDTDAKSYEPHYLSIDSPEKVQLYEVILADPQGDLTTGLLTALSYVKDNRLLPNGFDKKTADDDIAVRGSANEDKNFSSEGDRVRYSVDLTAGLGPFKLEAELLYQPIGYRWAKNLQSIDSFETNRFSAYYSSMAASSAAMISSDSMVVR
jgi:cytochrome c551/c552